MIVNLALDQLEEQAGRISLSGIDEPVAKAAIEEYVEDIEAEEGRITVFTPHTEFARARAALNEAFGDIDFEVEEIQFVPRETSAIPAEDEPMFEKFLDMLNDVEDVQKVYHNVG